MKRLVILGIVIRVTLLAGGCSQQDPESFARHLREYESASAWTGAAPLQPAVSASRGELGSAPGQWMLLAVQLGQTDEAQTSVPSTPEIFEPTQTFVPWKQRRGPAYPDDFWRSFGRDVKELPATVWDDTKATFTDPWALVGFGAAVASGVAIDLANGNGCAADHFEENRSQLNDFWDMVGDVGGNPGAHFAVAGTMYFASLYNKDTKNYEISKTLINALALNGLVTLGLKGIANSESPNGEDFGWPSGHTSSTFCLATVLHKAYGPWVGIPMFAFATFVGYERIDARNHDFNDVISGALIGIAIGHAVWQNHEPKVFGMDVVPFTDARGGVGIALSKKW